MEFNKDLLEKQYKDLNSIHKVAKIYNCDSSTILLYLKKFGISTERKSVISIPKDELEKAYLELKSTRKVAQKFNCSAPTIASLLRKYEIKILSDGAARQYSVNDNFFSVDTPQSFYWAGFLAADGNIDKNLYRLTIKLSQKDLSHLELFKKHLLSDAKIFFKKEKLSIYGSCYIRVSSNKLINDLINKFNVTPNKTKTFKMNDWTLNHKFVNHFIRGYIDGDGSYTITDRGKTFKISLLGNLEFMMQFKSLMENKCLTNINKIILHKNMHYVSYTGNKQCAKIIKFLFQDAGGTFLKRKFNKIIEAKYLMRKHLCQKI
jgi:intein-encoded DNA endonuclease-like protein